MEPPSDFGSGYSGFYETKYSEGLFHFAVYRMNVVETDIS